MPSVEELVQTLSTAFDPQQASVLARVIHDSYSELVKTSDFNELKAIVRDLANSQRELAEAQKRTETRVEELAEAQKRTETRVEELAEAQKRTETRVGELAVAQTRTEARVEQLAVQMKQLARDVGGLARSAAYSLENEAYRALPAFLKAKYGIDITDRLVRTQLDGKEVNLFAQGSRNGKPIVIVGETKLQLDERRGNRREEELVLSQLIGRTDLARRQYPDVEVVPVLLTHYARPAFLQRAQDQGVIVIQSFEW
jgi:DNA repair ATPase RecN